MARDLSRLLRPRSVALFGGEPWCRAVIGNLRAMGYVWDVWPVTGAARPVDGIRSFASAEALPAAPDAAFLGPDASAPAEILMQLSQRRAGGAVVSCALPEGLPATGDMAVLGPGCPGFVNAVDRAALWSGPQGLAPVKRGVAIIADSAGMAQGLSLQRRALPVAQLAVICAGHPFAGMAEALLSDERVTALGIQTETPGDLEGLLALGEVAQKLGKPVVFLRSGRDTGTQALMDRAGFAQVTTPEAFLEALKILHMAGPLPANALALASCGGADAGFAGGALEAAGLELAPLSESQTGRLARVLGDGGVPGNPLACQGLMSAGPDALARGLGELMSGAAVFTMVLLDAPGAGTTAPTGYQTVLRAAAAAHRRVGMPLAVVALLPESLPEGRAEALAAEGVIPLGGLSAACEALGACIALGTAAHHAGPVLMPDPEAVASGVRLSDAEARLALGLTAPPHSGAWPEEAQALDLTVSAEAGRGYVLTLRTRSDAMGREASSLLPVTAREIAALLVRLRAEGDGKAVVQAVGAVQDYLKAQRGRVSEIAISPLFLTAERAAAGDVRIRVAPRGGA